MPKMDPFYEGVSIVGDYDYRGVNMKLARKRTIPLMGGLFGRRDFTFISVSDLPRSDGALVSGTISVITEKLPKQVGYTRAYQDSVAFYENIDADPITGNPRALLTIVTRIDLNDNSYEGEGGGIPMWLYVKTVGSTGVLALRKMRNEVSTIFEERLFREVNRPKFQHLTIPKSMHLWENGKTRTDNAHKLSHIKRNINPFPPYILKFFRVQAKRSESDEVVKQPRFKNISVLLKRWVSG